MLTRLLRRLKFRGGAVEIDEHELPPCRCHSYSDPNRYVVERLLIMKHEVNELLDHFTPF